ncbi:ABC transporter permease [Occultella aeris]|uniref:Aliphatic sulfonates transport permease protein SsuC n=2 Tax=Occultella aeris TaxID=2761496 RepID=A0A7M4DRE5_9MICO|nr:Putative aliphatic sulfonates transport permease protein SsuC [Occultella aeris]
MTKATGTASTTAAATTASATDPAAATSAVGHRRTGARTRRALSAVGSLWLLAALLVAWEIVARLSPSVFFPPFSVVLGQFGQDWFAARPQTLFASDRFLESVPVSLSRLARGWLLAAVLGVAIGVVLGRSRVARHLYSPVIRFWMSVPNAALLPIALQFFGITEAMNIFLITFGSMWLIAVNTADGVAGVDPSWLRAARSMRLPRPVLYLRVILPAAAPHILAGLRISLGFGLILMIVAELYATTAGLGHDVALYQQTFRYREMWSAFLLIALIGIALNAAVDLLERRLLRWQRRTGLASL